MDEVAAYVINFSSQQMERELIQTDVPCSRYRSPAEVIENPQTIFRKSLIRVSDNAGEFFAPGAPFQFLDSTESRLATVPNLGFDGNLSELGYSSDRIEQICGK